MSHSKTRLSDESGNDRMVASLIFLPHHLKNLLAMGIKAKASMVPR